MNAHGCHGATRSGVTHLAGWVLPGVGLALVPKCPMCLAAYVAFATGVALPLPAATWLRGALLTICIASLLLLAARWVRSALSIGRASDRRSFRVGECRHS